MLPAAPAPAVQIAPVPKELTADELEADQKEMVKAPEEMPVSLPKAVVDSMGVSIDSDFFKELVNVVSEDAKDDSIQWKSIFMEIGHNSFDPTVTLQLLSGIMTKKQMVLTATMVALRGPKAAQKIKASFLGGKSLQDLGIIQRRNPRPDKLTPSRILAALPDFAAHGLMKMKVPKRIASSSLPASLQFPAAAGIVLSVELRRAHYEFCVQFSEMIGGEFNESLYLMMEGSAIQPRVTIMENSDDKDK